MIGGPRLQLAFAGPIDRATADRLLSGRLDPDDAPPRYADVARIIRALRAPPSREELVNEGAAVAAAVRVLVGTTTSPIDRGFRSAPASRSGARRFGLVAIAAALLMTSMAAADVLPERTRDAISDALSVVGIDVPRAAREPADPAATMTHPASTGAKVAQVATETAATGVQKGARISRLASGGMSRAGEQRANAHSSRRAKASNGRPGERGNGPPKQAGRGSASARGASGRTNAPGTAVASEASNGRSNAGRGNAPAHR